MNYVIGAFIFFGMNSLFYFAFADKKKISLKNYLKGSAVFVLKCFATLVAISSLVWIPLLLTALTK